jgi:fructokinase
LGVGAFGPIVLDRSAPDYGCLLQTNKPGWSGFDLANGLRSVCGIAPYIVTDVAAAGIAEARLGALRNSAIGVYLTVGTGIGGAIICGGEPLPALLHPEMGHISLKRHADDAAPSTCRFHDSCAEGLAAGPAILKRFGQSLSHFAEGGRQHQMVADYLGQLCASLVLTLSPQRIILGGGVGKTPGLVTAAQAAMVHHLAGYAPTAIAAEDFICSPHFGQDAGITGALLLADQAHSAIVPLRHSA